MRSVTVAASAAAALAVAGLVVGSPSSAAAKAHDENPSQVLAWNEIPDNRRVRLVSAVGR